jgi:hypothetical protein
VEGATGVVADAGADAEVEAEFAAGVV